MADLILDVVFWGFNGAYVVAGAWSVSRMF